MKKIYLLFIVLLILYSPVISQTSQIETLQFTSHNWIIGWGVDFKIKLENTGAIRIDNIKLRIIYKAVNKKLSYSDTVFVNWGETLNTNQKTTKYFSQELPYGYKVETAYLRLYY